MKLDPRILRARFYFDEGKDVIEYGEGFEVSFSASKNVFSYQNYGRVEIRNIKASVRAEMLSQFNQFRQRTLRTPFLPVDILAGRESYGGSACYMGNVIKCSLLPPPDIGVVIEVATNQIDKTKWVTYWPKAPVTYGSLCRWAADQLDLVPEIHLPTELDNAPVRNFLGGNQGVLEALPVYIQRYYPDQVVAFIDDKSLVVKPIEEVVPSLGVVELGYGTQLPFIGIPEWTEFGIKGKVLFTPSIRLGCGVKARSIMNPTIDGDYVVGKLDYELTSRQTPFYVGFTAYPAARTA